MTLRANPGRLLAYQAATLLAAEVTTLATTLRGPAAVEHGNQLVRAALSVPSNIAEACGRGTIGEFRQFLGYARGSAQEVRSQLRMVRVRDVRRASWILELEHRATLVIKLLYRLHDRPPPER